MNTFLIATMFVGAISMVVMRREVFPNFALEIVLVAVPFPGATPDETEEGICQKIESSVANLDGVNLLGADLTGATGVADSADGIFYSNTTCPNGDIVTSPAKCLFGV